MYIWQVNLFYDSEGRDIRSIILFSLLFGICCPSLAVDKTTDGTKVYPPHREDVLKRLFLDSVITSQTYHDKLLHPDDIAVTQSAYPWLYPHLVPENGLPKPLAVNKWTQPIRIAFGMPNDLKPFEDAPQNGKRAFKLIDPQLLGGKWTGFYFAINDRIADIKNYDRFSVVENEIKVFAEVVSPIVGIPVSYIAPDLETKEQYGNIRINLFKDDSLITQSADQLVSDGAFKRVDRQIPGIYGVKWGSFAHVPTSFAAVESAFRGPLVFHNAKRHVEGYLLANEKNEIDMAVCYIWQGHKLEILRGLIRECLMRSMGFPDTAYPLSGVLDKELSILGSWNGNTGPIPRYSDYLHQPFSLTDTDRFFLRLLYNQKIRAGMDYMTARKIIDEPHNE